jgi:hypothetical protein
MPKTLKNYTVAISGKFGESRKSDDIKRWVEANGGKFARNYHEGVTHFICSKLNYKKNIQLVQKAKKNKKCFIVTIDWLEECLDDKARHHGSNYLCRTAFKESAAEKAERKKREKAVLRKDGTSSPSASQAQVSRSNPPNFSVHRFNEGCSMAMADLYSGT